MTQSQLDEAIANQYDNGRYSPLGADGGVLQYIATNVNGKEYWASITLDHDIAKIRRLWEVTERDPVTHEVIENHYNLTKTYYNIRSN